MFADPMMDQVPSTVQSLSGVRSASLKDPYSRPQEFVVVEARQLVSQGVGGLPPRSAESIKERGQQGLTGRVRLDQF